MDHQDTTLCITNLTLLKRLIEVVGDALGRCKTVEELDQKIKDIGLRPLLEGNVIHYEQRQAFMGMGEDTRFVRIMGLEFAIIHNIPNTPDGLNRELTLIPLADEGMPINTVFWLTYETTNDRLTRALLSLPLSITPQGH